MKVPTFIWAIYILFLTGLPCADHNMNEVFQGSGLVLSEYSCAHSNCDACAPFCACNCCATPGIHEPYMATFDIIPVLSGDLPVIEALLVPCHFNAIWQPPKIG